MDEFLFNHNEDDYTIEQVCRIMGVSRAGYYSWKAGNQKALERKEKQRKGDEEIMQKMRAIVKTLCYVPGKKTFRAFLWRDYGLAVSVKRCRHLMQEMNLKANPPIKDAYKNQATHSHEAAAPENRLQREFYVGPRKVVLTDITYFYYGPTRETFYLCVFRDPFVAQILGLAISERMDQALVNEAYQDMMTKHGSELHAPDVMLHSDQGSQYTSTCFKQLLKEDGFIQSMSGRGCSLDNAPMESFFSQLKARVLSIIALCRDFASAKTILENYIVDYNAKHYQWGLAGLTPDEYYIYVTTGVYPCDNYYGVKASEMMAIEDLVKERDANAAKRAAKRREQYKANKAKTQSAEDICIRIARDRAEMDRLYRQLNGVINAADALMKKCLEDSARAQSKLALVASIIEDIDRARDFVNGLSKEDRQVLSELRRWSEYDELSYYTRMEGLFNDNPFHEFCDEIGMSMSRERRHTRMAG